MSSFEEFDPCIGIMSIAPIANERHGRLAEFVPVASDPFDVAIGRYRNHGKDFVDST